MRSIIARYRHLPFYAAGQLDCVDGAATQQVSGKYGLWVPHYIHRQANAYFTQSVKRHLCWIGTIEKLSNIVLLIIVLQNVQVDTCSTHRVTREDYPGPFQFMITQDPWAKYSCMILTCDHIYMLLCIQYGMFISVNIWQSGHISACRQLRLYATWNNLYTWTITTRSQNCQVASPEAGGYCVCPWIQKCTYLGREQSFCKDLLNPFHYWLHTGPIAQYYSLICAPQLSAGGGGGLFWLTYQAVYSKYSKPYNFHCLNILQFDG